MTSKVGQRQWLWGTESLLPGLFSYLFLFSAAVFLVLERKAVIFFDIKKPTTYIFQSHLHSVWRPLKMYVDFSSERFSLCILFTFIKPCPAQYFIFIVASGPSWQHGLCEKQNKAKHKESKGLLLREYEKGRQMWLWKWAVFLSGGSAFVLSSVCQLSIKLLLPFQHLLS